MLTSKNNVTCVVGCVLNMRITQVEQDAKIRRLQEEKEVKASLLKDIDTELVAKRNELHDVVKLRYGQCLSPLYRVRNVCDNVHA